MEQKTEFHICKTCSNMLTKECTDDCILTSTFRHYRQRPGTDIADLPPFPLEDLMKLLNPYTRLLMVGVYLRALTDYIQHPDDYEKNRRDYNKEDYSI